MTELKSFLAGIYDALSEAEMAAIVHGQTRRAELQERGVLPRNMDVPVYHASNVEVTLDVGLTAEETDEGTRVFIEESSDNDSTVTFSVELFELIEEQDMGEIDYDEILDVSTGVNLPPTDLDDTLPPTGTEPDEGSTTDDGGNADGDDRDDTGDDDGTETEDGTANGPTPGASDVESGLSPGELADELTAPTGRPASSADEVENIDDIGPTYGERLRAEGIETTADLASLSATEVADIVSTENHTVSAERTASWLDTIGALDEGTDESDGSDGSTDNEEPPDGEESTDNGESSDTDDGTDESGANDVDDGTNR